MRKLIIILACTIAILLVGFVAYRGYQSWRESRLMSMTKASLAHKDSRNAVLSLAQLLRSNPHNLEATRIMAELMEAERDPTALFWWQRTLEINPKSFEDRLALAKAALIYRDFALATNTLAGVAEADQKTANFQSMAGGIALMMGKLDQAQVNFSEALRLEPLSPLNKVNLALLHLHGTNALDLAEARIDLERVVQGSTNADLVLLSQRELVMDALRFDDINRATSLSQKLVKMTNAPFSDSLLRLEVLLKAKSPEFKPTLARFEREATNNAATLVDLSSWQMNRLSPAVALSWLQSLPPALQTNPPAAVLAARCKIIMADWTGLQFSLERQNWGDLDFERHAVLARTFREQNMAAASKSEWQQAVNATKNNKMALKTLFGFSQQWGWTAESVQILWNIFNLYPEEKTAWMSLRQYLFASGNTPSLLHLIDIQNRRNPADISLKNDLALTALLLKLEEFKPHDLARENYLHNETNAAIASTYAFSLHLQGKQNLALKVMQLLKPQDLADPGIAGYYGLILKANGRKAEALTYLKISASGQLLPEERALFSKAENSP